MRNLVTQLLTFRINIALVDTVLVRVGQFGLQRKIFQHIAAGNAGDLRKKRGRAVMPTLMSEKSLVKLHRKVLVKSQSRRLLDLSQSD